jgi:uncharacterized protein (TIGR02453 family)
MIKQETLQFIQDLKDNNNRDWFQANQKRYDVFKKDYKDLVANFITELSKGDESLKHLEFKDCSFRINRDIRFSKDKSPYKTNLGIWMSAGNKNTNFAGYYVHIEPGASFIAGGVHWPDAADLKKIRREIDGFYEDLDAIVEDKEFKKIYGKLDRDENNSLKTVPKGYAKLSDKDISDKNFVVNTAKKLLVLKPLVEFINRGLTTE